MIAEPLEKGLAEDIENEKVLITWNKWVDILWSTPDIKTIYVNQRLNTIDATICYLFHTGKSLVNSSRQSMIGIYLQLVQSGPLDQKIQDLIF